MSGPLVRVVVDDGQAEREFEVVVEDPGATVAQLLHAAGIEPPDAVTVAGRIVPTQHTIVESAIPDGSVVRLGRHPPPPVLGVAGAVGVSCRVTVVAGTSAGASVALDRPVVVGRAPDCDLVVASPTVSQRHCRILDDGRGGVVVTDLSSRNGTWVDGERVPGRGGRRVPLGVVVRCGAAALRAVPTDDDRRPRALDPLRYMTPAGTVPFNRPPRPGPPAATPAIEPIAPPPSDRSAARFDVIALVAPLVLGGIMVLVMRDLRFALLMVLSPLMMVVNTVGDRRRAGRDARRAARAHRVDVQRFVTDVRAAQAAETDRAWRVLPSLAEVRRRGTVPTTRLWERRRRDPDQLVLAAGVGSVPFRPMLAGSDDRRNGSIAPTGRRPLTDRILDAAPRLPDAPVPVDLSHGGVVGVVGDRGVALALARALVVQAAVHHGPADLGVMAMVHEHTVGGWTWLPWLPHTAGVDPDGERLMAVGAAATEDVARSLLADERRRRRRPTTAGGGRAGAAVGADEGGGRPDRRTLMVVVDSPSALRGRDAPVRAVLRGEAGPVAGIVVAEHEDDLPAVCDTVVTCGSAGDARLVRPAERDLVPDLLVAGLAEQDARRVARRLAGLDDPEVPVDAGELPARVDLLDLLDLGDPGVGHRADAAAVSAASIARWWDSTADGATVTTPIGAGRDGAVLLDLDEDGPHGLVGGTTGSGKSELLRSLVAGLAARHHPDVLTFVLVDYKGGAAFDVCADLPHVVGLVTDLDEHLGERALRSLEAELEHRERRLRDRRVSDLCQWSRLPLAERGEPMPRLLVVVDEFATLRAELPDFVSALVSIAQRGRSLGVHLLLGTQRPSGAVDENVRANSNLRIALRVTDRQDSTDVVGVTDAADIPPSLPGRGIVRIGPGAVTRIQTALVTGVRERGNSAAVRVQPLRVTGRSTNIAARSSVAPDGRTDLDHLVAACRQAFTGSGAPPPRRPWLPALPSTVPLDELATAPLEVAGGRVLPMALVDLPDRQAQLATGWDLTAGPLLLHGVVGSGTTTVAAAAVLAATADRSPDDLHVQVLDLGRGELTPLDDLPHTGAVVTGREDERRRRLLRWLVAEGSRRRRLDVEELAGEPRLLVVVDGFTQLLDELDEAADYDEHEALLRLVAGSAQLRISCLLTTTRVGGLRSSLTAAVEQRWALRLASPDELALLGLRPSDVAVQPPGRAVRAADGRVLQVGRPAPLAQAVEAVARRWPSPTRAPAEVRALPDVVPAASIACGLLTPREGAWSLPVGIADDDLGIAALPLHPGEHALLLGPPGSGRSGLLGAVAEIASAGGLDVVVTAGSAGSPLTVDGDRAVVPAALPDVLRERSAADRPLLVLVDDADRIDVPRALLEALAKDGPRIHLVCTARPGPIQADFGHWLRQVARSHVGAVLRASGDGAADLLGHRVPRRTPAAETAGRGWLVAGGVPRFVQLATPTPR